MKKLAALALATALLASPALAAEGAEPEVSAPAAVLMEKRTGTVLFASGEDERRAPASVTKVMTLLLAAEAVERGDIALEDVVTASQRAQSMGGSQIWLEAGEEMSVSELIKCVAVVSANDCAVALAEHIAGSEAAFVERMNARSAELGLQNTHFTNCTGLFDDPEHYTSALDLAVMSRELLGREWIKDYTTIWTDSIRGGEFGLANTNKLLRSLPGCTGLKTGWTNAAGYCVAASCEREGTEYIAVVMGAESSESRNADAAALIEYGFANWALCPALDSALPRLRVELGEADTVQTELAGGGMVLLERGDIQALERRVELPESVPAPVEAGDKLGALTLTSGGRTLAQLPLTASESAARLSAGGILLRMLLGLVNVPV